MHKKLLVEGSLCKNLVPFYLDQLLVSLRTLTPPASHCCQTFHQIKYNTSSLPLLWRSFQCWPSNIGCLRTEPTRTVDLVKSPLEWGIVLSVEVVISAQELNNRNLPNNSKRKDAFWSKRCTRKKVYIVTFFIFDKQTQMHNRLERYIANIASLVGDHWK